VIGSIQFDPKDGEANGKSVRNIVVQQTGFGPTAVKVNATVWPSHAHIPLKQGDIVHLEGKYTPNKTTNDETGETRTYHNLSVTRMKVLGTLDAGKKTETVNTGSDDDFGSDDDIPF
jgi:hypothetical protein